MSRRTLAIILVIELIGALSVGAGIVFAVRLVLGEYIPIELRAGAALLIVVVAGMAFAWIVDHIEAAIASRVRRRNGGLQA